MAALQKKFIELHKALSASLVERSEEVTCMLAACVAGEHFLMVGPPGTAKSLLCRNLAYAVSGAEVFEKLLGKGTEPEELFGPVRLSKLREDVLEYNVDGYLPTAHIGFIDEIGKASMAIINSLLTISNERKFQNGSQVVDCPLQVLVAASNEWPVGEGYETGQAMFDRFLFRKYVGGVSMPSMENVIFGDLPEVPAGIISVDDMVEARAQASSLVFSEEAKRGLLQIIQTLRYEGIRVSERRCRKAANAAKAMAWLTGSAQVELRHLEILQHCLWEDPTSHVQKCAEVVLSIACPGSESLPRLVAEATDILDSMDLRTADQTLVSQYSKLTDVVEKLKGLPGARAKAAYGRFLAAQHDVFAVVGKM